MERIPTELIYLLLFLGIIVFNYVMQQAARRRRAEEEAQAQAEAEAQLPQEELLDEDVWGRTSAPPPPPAIVLAPRPVPPPPPAAPPPPPPAVRRRRSPARALLNTKQGLRQAIVLAMILERPRL